MKRVYREFTGGKSINAIAKDFNEEQVPTRRSGDWNTSTISRILKNEKYTGRWVWRKFKNVRDPMTGKRKQVERAEKEQIVSFNENLMIIDAELWAEAQKRWAEVEGVWPGASKAGVQQKSYVHSNPTHLLAGLLQCKACGGAMVQVSGKGGGYYGCYNNKRKVCSNALMMPRKKAETIIIGSLREKFLTADNLAYVYENVEKMVRKTLSEVPEELRQKKHQYEKVQLELQNLLSFIKAGNFSRVVSDAISEAENKSERLKGEMSGLELQHTNAFKSPPKEWIEYRLEKLHETLCKNTKASALALKDLLGSIEMEPVRGECMVENGQLIESRGYYVAHTNIETLALLDEDTQRPKGSNWLHWRKR